MGQTSFYNSPTTWNFFPKSPSLLVWGAILEDPLGHSFAVKSTKNKKALNQLFSAVEGAKGICIQSSLSKRKAVSDMLLKMDVNEIIEALHFDDPESEYDGLRDPHGKQHIEGLAIIFTGSYNDNKPCFPANYTPYDLLDTNVEYTAVLKINWQKMFPDIVMMQRTACIQKSTLQKFLLTRNKKKPAGMSISSSSYVTPISHKNDDRSRTSAEDYNAYIKFTENSVLTAQNMNATNTQNDAAMSEYALDTSDLNSCGYAMLHHADNTSVGVDFNLDETVKNNRTFRAKAGTHRWRVFREIDIVGKLKVDEGDYVVVLGIKNLKIIVEDPIHLSELKSKIRTFLVDPAYFYTADLLHLSPEST